MGLFGKSFEDKVHGAIETLRGQFPMAQIAADIDILQMAGKLGK